MNSATKQPTVRQMNSHLFAGTGYCYVTFADGRRMRISWARTRKGIIEGRVINCDGWTYTPMTWEQIPADAVVELS